MQKPVKLSNVKWMTYYSRQSCQIELFDFRGNKLTLEQRHSKSQIVMQIGPELDVQMTRKLAILKSSMTIQKKV